MSERSYRCETNRPVFSHQIVDPSDVMPNPLGVFDISPERVNYLATRRDLRQQFFVGMGDISSTIPIETLEKNIPLIAAVNAEIASLIPGLSELTQKVMLSFSEAGIDMDDRPTLAESVVFLTNDDDLSNTIGQDKRLNGRLDNVGGSYDDITDLAYINLSTMLKGYEIAVNVLESRKTKQMVGYSQEAIQANRLIQIFNYSIAKAMIEEYAHLLSVDIDKDERKTRKGLYITTFPNGEKPTEVNNGLNEMATTYIVYQILLKSSLRSEFQRCINDDIEDDLTLELKLMSRIVDIVGQKTLEKAYFKGKTDEFIFALNNPKRKTKLTKDSQRFNKLSAIADLAYQANLEGNIEKINEYYHSMLNLLSL